jgi:hypothetical protein
LLGAGTNACWRISFARAGRPFPQLAEQTNPRPLYESIVRYLHITRKSSLGSQSEEGERTIERLLSASVTCRLQKRSLFAYLSAVLAAEAHGGPIPLPA